MAKYSVFYNTTLYYEVEVEADSWDEARDIVTNEMGIHEEYDIESIITSVEEITND